MKSNKHLKELDPWREIIEEMAPFGETPEQVMEDKTEIQINAPRAMMSACFKAKVSMLLRLKKEGLLKEPGEDT